MANKTHAAAIAGAEKRRKPGMAAPPPEERLDASREEFPDGE